MNRFKVLQFNMQFGQTWDAARPDDAPVDLARTVAAIRGAEADIVLLQEVEPVGAKGSRREPAPNHALLARELAPMHSVFAYPPFNERELPFGIGLAIFSRHPLRDFVQRPLPAADLEFKFNGTPTSPTDRLLIGATTEIGGQAVRVFNTHLQAYFMIGATSDDYPEQRRIVESVLREERGPALIGGDFNLGPGETLVPQFERAGYRTAQNASTTWKRRPYITDHLFYNRSLKCVAAAVQPTDASDHDMLVAEFELRG
jgi:endonuclease/exonuclease/phosphatase family metal-dependent hydrolase